MAARDRDILFQGLSQEELDIALKVLSLLAARIAAPLNGALNEDAQPDEEEDADGDA